VKDKNSEIIIAVDVMADNVSSLMNRSVNASDIEIALS